MPKSAFPEGYKLGPDNQSWFMRIKKKVQAWFAAGPRVSSGFWKWHEFPITSFALKYKGMWRLENTDGTIFNSESRNVLFDWIGYIIKDYGPGKRVGEFLYLSRIQPWTRWHFSINWPFFVNFHLIYRVKDIVEYPEYRSDFGIGKMFTFYFGWKRDSNKVYIPTIYGGGNFE